MSTNLENDYRLFLQSQGKSTNTIKSYVMDISLYMKWFLERFGKDPEQLYRENILEYRSYLQNVRSQKAKKPPR